MPKELLILMVRYKVEKNDLPTGHVLIDDDDSFDLTNPIRLWIAHDLVQSAWRLSLGLYGYTGEHIPQQLIRASVQLVILSIT